jgi:hypothetical protein
MRRVCSAIFGAWYEPYWNESVGNAVSGKPTYHDKFVIAMYGALDDLHAGVAASGRIASQPTIGDAPVLRQEDEGEIRRPT